MRIVSSTTYRCHFNLKSRIAVKNPLTYNITLLQEFFLKNSIHSLLRTGRMNICFFFIEHAIQKNYTMGITIIIIHYYNLKIQQIKRSNYCQMFSVFKFNAFAAG